jgi:hypothetical protein
MTVFEHPGPAKPSDEIKSFVGAIQALVAVEAERDHALAALERVRVLVKAHPLDWRAIRAALEEPS